MPVSTRVTLLSAIALAGCQTVRAPAPPATPLNAAQIAMLQAQGFIETDDGWLFDMSSRLLFPSDDSALNPGQDRVLEGIAAALCSVEIRAARIEGHADNTGSSAHNRALSRARAEAVAAALATGGMPRGLLRPAGLGDTQPIESNRTRRGRAENRRVAIIVAASAAEQGPCAAG